MLLFCFRSSESKRTKYGSQESEEICQFLLHVAAWAAPIQVATCSPRLQPLSALYFVLGAIHEFVGAGNGTSGSAGLLVLVAWETNAEELNPFTINQPPVNISHKPPGSEEARPKPDPIISDSIPTKMMAYPTRPQIARTRGTNFALYNV